MEKARRRADGEKDVGNFDDDGEITIERVYNMVGEIERKMKVDKITEQQAQRQALGEVSRKIDGLLDHPGRPSRDPQAAPDQLYRGNATMDLLKKVEALEMKMQLQAKALSELREHQEIKENVVSQPKEITWAVLHRWRYAIMAGIMAGMFVGLRFGVWLWS